MPKPFPQRRCISLPKIAASSIKGSSDTVSNTLIKLSHPQCINIMMKLTLQLLRRAVCNNPPCYDKSHTPAVFSFVHVVGRNKNCFTPREKSYISSQKFLLIRGSTPEVGSSRKSIEGSCMIALPSASLCFIPPGSSPTLSFFRVPIAAISRTYSILSLRCAPVSRICSRRTPGFPQH